MGLDTSSHTCSVVTEMEPGMKMMGKFKTKEDAEKAMAGMKNAKERCNRSLCKGPDAKSALAHTAQSASAAQSGHPIARPYDRDHWASNYLPLQGDLLDATHTNDALS